MHRNLFWAALIGVAGGFCATGYRHAITGMEWLLTGRSGGLVEISMALPPLYRFLIPTAGGLMAGMVLWLGRKLDHGKKAPDYMEALSVGDGSIPVRQSLMKSLSSLFSIASGASIGREGSMVQLSALAASQIGSIVNGPGPCLRLLTACGVAAGLASVYNAPISGTLFVSEIILGSVAIDTLSPLMLSAALAVITSRYLGGADTYFRASSFSLVSSFEMALYFAMGIGLGLFAPVYVWILRESRRRFRNTNLPLYVRLGLGGAAVGAISLICPQVWGNGHSMVAAVMDTHWVLGPLLLLLVCKLAATAATFGSGAVGGVFTPTLFMGAMLGNVTGHAMNRLFPGMTAGPNAFTIVAMGGFLAAATRAPMTAMLMLFEMTLDSGIVLPLIITCVTATIVARRLSPSSLYSESLGPDHPSICNATGR